MASAQILQYCNTTTKNAAASANKTYIESYIRHSNHTESEFEPIERSAGRPKYRGSRQQLSTLSLPIPILYSIQSPISSANVRLFDPGNGQRSAASSKLDTKQIQTILTGTAPETTKGCPQQQKQQEPQQEANYHPHTRHKTADELVGEPEPAPAATAAASNQSCIWTAQKPWKSWRVQSSTTWLQDSQMAPRPVGADVDTPNAQRYTQHCVRRSGGAFCESHSDKQQHQPPCSAPAQNEIAATIAASNANNRNNNKNNKKQNEHNDSDSDSNSHIKSMSNQASKGNTLQHATAAANTATATTPKSNATNANDYRCMHCKRTPTMDCKMSAGIWQQQKINQQQKQPEQLRQTATLAKCCPHNHDKHVAVAARGGSKTKRKTNAVACQQQQQQQKQQQQEYQIQSRLSSRYVATCADTAVATGAVAKTLHSATRQQGYSLSNYSTKTITTTKTTNKTKQRTHFTTLSSFSGNQDRDVRISTMLAYCRNAGHSYCAAMRANYTKSLAVSMGWQKLLRLAFSFIIIFNMLPLLNAGMFSFNANLASNYDASELRSGPNPEPRPWIPVVAYLEPLPRPPKLPKCDQTFVSRIGGPQNGTFSAPLLHNHKNHSRQCLYTFLAGPGQRVEVVFTSFNLRGNPPDSGSAVGELPTCVHEYMDIYSEVQSSDPAELINSPFGGRYCGTIPPRRRISMYRAIAISFFTNKNVTTPDLFDGTYRFINASEYEIGIPIAGSPCSYTITPSMSINKTGALISPTYPGAYPKDMSCTYQFLGEANQRVRLEFRDFDLFFGGPHCPFDYVKVYDGPDNSSALIGTYCGQQRNLVLYSSESSLFVHFYTLPRTANTQNRGFKGIYEFSESFVKLDFIRENDGIHIRGSECDQKILSKKESTGYVLSPNYPYPYIPKTVCRYFIYGMQDAQHLERVRLEFSAFNIPKVEHKDKGESNCTDGYLKIYLKGQETADAYDKFDYELCGNETQRVVSDGPRLAMVFSSGELQGRGFKGKYTFETEYKIPGTAAPDGTCSFTYVSSSKKRGELNSPRYPSNYPSDTNCSYLFLGEPNEQVTIVFDHFKIKADGNANATAGAYGSGVCFEDWLEMYVVYRDNNDRLLGRYCGLTAPGPVESPRGAVGLRITLHTDQENVASGFKARYFFETTKSDVAECGGNFSNEDSGIITSPNYPAPYKAPSRGMASMACNWIMTARPGYKLSINFEQFSIEGDPANRGCPAAVLRLWVNVDSDQPPVELCGEKPPIEHWHYISTGQTARISFTTSDKTVGAQGFRIVWTEIQDSGPGPPSIGLLCESTYHFQCEVGYCISDKLRCDGVKNCGPGDDSDELHCTTEAPEEDHGVLIIITLVVVSFLICLLCTLCHSRRKQRRNVTRQLGLHRNAHYDSQTSATGLSSSRRHLQSGASISGSLHGINSGSLMIPPAPLPPTSVPPPPHICIAGVDGIGGGMLINDDDDDDLDDDDGDMQHEIFINDVRFDEEECMENLNHLENV